MERVIQDVIPVENVSTEQMIHQLWKRGVGIKQIFGQFYALEEMAAHQSDMIFGNDEEGQHGRQPLTVADAELAGVHKPEQPIDERPF